MGRGWKGRWEWWCGVECGRSRVTLSGTWSRVLLARHGGGACGAGRRSGGALVCTESVHPQQSTLGLLGRG